MTSIFNNFIAILLSSVTVFTGSLNDVNMTPEPEKLNTPIQVSIDNAAQIAQNKNMNVGIAIVDRAHGNTMRTNASPAHAQVELSSLARLFIFFYAIRVDKDVARGDVPEIISMMQTSSTDSTNEMWDKYGRESIIRDTSRRYNLQETTPSTEWSTSKSSAVDIARLYRRFIDDPDVSRNAKIWAISLLRDTSPTIAGEDFSWGLPTAFGVDGSSENEELAWVQGYSSSDSDTGLRASTGLFGQSLQYIAVTIAVPDDNMSNAEADSVMTEVAGTLTDDGKITENELNRNSPYLDRFMERQKERFGSLVEK